MVITIVAEDGSIGRKGDARTVLLIARFLAFFFQEIAGAEFRHLRTTITNRLHPKAARKGIDRLGTDAIQANAFLKRFGIVLAAGVDLRYALHHFAQRNTASEVTNIDMSILDGYFDRFAVTHDELVDTVIDDFLQEYVNAVVFRRAIAQLTDVHTGAGADVLFPVKRANAVLRVAVFRFLLFCHILNRLFQY